MLPKLLKNRKAAREVTVRMARPSAGLISELSATVTVRRPPLTKLNLLSRYPKFCDNTLCLNQRA
jgi:hypothetical protein